jgi:hypothetical protein
MPILKTSTLRRGAQRSAGAVVALTLMATLCSGCNRGASQQQEPAVSPIEQKQKVQDSIRNNPNMPPEQKQKMIEQLK